MALLSYNEITPRTIIVLDGDIYEILDSQVSRKQQNKPVNRVKMRNLRSGSVKEHTFHMADKVEEADVDRRKMVFEFVNDRKGEAWFSDVDNPSNRVALGLDVVGSKIELIPAKGELTVLFVDDEPVTVIYPVTVNLTVKEAPPAVKGNTVTGGTKTVVLETGAKLNVPLFIEAGDVVKVNVEKGEYVERVGK